MSKDNIVSLLMPGGIEDSLTELLRNGARRLIQQAIEAELAEMLAKYEGQTDEQGRRAVVRNGYLPEREILTGVGPVTVKVRSRRMRLASPLTRCALRVAWRHCLVVPSAASAVLAGDVNYPRLKSGACPCTTQTGGPDAVPRL